MKKYLRAAAMMIGVAASSGAWAEEDEDSESSRPRAALPAIVQARLSAEHPQATVTAATRWGDGWEARVADGVRSVSLRFDAAGNLLERHVPVEVKALPTPVLATLDRAWPRHTVWRATRIETEAGDFHEVLLARGDRRTVALLDPDARVLTGRSHS